MLIYMNNNTVIIPREKLEKFFSVFQLLHELEDEFESYLIGGNPRLLKKLEQARSEHRRRAFGNWDTLKRKYV